MLAQPPTRKFDDPGAPPFKVLKEGENPPLDAYDNFVIGPNYVPAPERKKVEGVPEGKVEQFEIDSKETKLFNPGIARDEFGKVDPNNPKTLIVETHPIDYKRKVGVYIPAQYKEGTEAPFMVVHDGPGQANGYRTILDNLIHQKRIPPIVLIAIGNGGGDAQGHERGKEYDNMNGDYAEYIETEVLPRVEKNCGVKLTKDPDGRAAMGNSSGGSAALIMAWFRNDLYRRVLTTSGTFVNQAWPFDPKYPDGAWGFHETLIPNSPKKPIRHVHLRRRRGPAQPQRDAGRDARLGRGQPPHGQGAEGQGLRVPVPVLPRGRPQRRQRPAAVPPARHRVGVEGVCPEDRTSSRRGRERLPGFR